MNSNKLKKEFENVYSDFFRNNRLILSMPFVATLSWDYSENFFWINIKQKITNRIYVWFNKITNPGIKVKQITYYSDWNHQFYNEELQIHSNLYWELDKYLNQKYWINWNWIEISILSELWWDVWLWFDSILLTLIILWIHNINWLINNEILVDIQKMSIEEVWNKYDKILFPIFNWSYEYLIKSYQFFPIVWDIASSFYYGNAPFITLSIPEYFHNEYSNIISHWWKSKLWRISDFIWCEDNFPAIDFSVINSWIPISLWEVLKSNNKIKNQINIIKNSTHTYLKAVLNDNSNVTKFYEDFLDLKNDTFNHTYNNLHLVISIETFYYLCKVYKDWYSEENINNLIRSLKKFQLINYLKSSSNNFHNFISYLELNINKKHDVAIFPNTTSIMWWTVSLISHKQRNRKDIYNGVIKVKDIYNASIIYESWSDWIEQKWLKIEQDLDNNFFSDYINWWEVIIYDMWWLEHITNLSNYLNEVWDYDIILDKITNRIILGWELLNSKVIPSQSYTIEIIHEINKNNCKLHSSLLNKSTYSSNKNEMYWKILLPLIKICRLKLWKELKISCIWTPSNYFINYEKSDIKICIINNFF